VGAGPRRRERLPRLSSHPATRAPLRAGRRAPVLASPPRHLLRRDHATRPTRGSGPRPPQQTGPPRCRPVGPLRLHRARGMVSSGCPVAAAARAIVEPDASAAARCGFRKRRGDREQQRATNRALCCLRSLQAGNSGLGRPTEEWMVVGRVCANAGVRHRLGVRDASEAAWAFQGLSGHLDLRVRELHSPWPGGGTRHADGRDRVLVTRDATARRWNAPVRARDDDVHLAEAARAVAACEPGAAIDPIATARSDTDVPRVAARRKLVELRREQLEISFIRVPSVEFVGERSGVCQVCTLVWLTRGWRSRVQVGGDLRGLRRARCREARDTGGVLAPRRRRDSSGPLRARREPVARARA